MSVIEDHLGPGDAVRRAVHGIADPVQRLAVAEELTERVEAVTAEDVREFAASLAGAESVAVAVVGPGGAATAFAEDTRARLAA